MATTTPVATTATTTPAATGLNGRRLIDSKALLQIIAKRKTLKLTHAGELIDFIVQGTPQFLPKGFAYMGPTGAAVNQFARTIYNVAASSSVSMSTPEVAQLLLDGMKAEGAGDAVGADSLFNEYLNKIQVSFSIIEEGRTNAPKFASGQLISAIVDVVSTKSGGTQIVINNPTAKASLKVAATTFSVSDLLAFAPVADAPAS